MTTETAQPQTPETPPPAPRPGRLCDNCGRELLGEHCYHCGQPTKGLVREFSTILGDLADTVFNIDSRIIRTIGPLFTRPGYLSLQYFAGHRVSYVSPVRLFVFMSLIAFVLAQWSFDIKVDDGDGGVRIGQSNEDSISKAKTVEEVEQVRKQALEGLDQGIREGGKVPGLGAGLTMAKAKVEEAAEKRIDQIKRAEAAKAQGTGTADKTASTENDDDWGDNDKIKFNGTAWDAKTNPVAISWLPAFANAGINTAVGRAEGNIKRGSKDPNLLKNAFLSVVPQTLFVLMPLFALLLKVMYFFKRRLYMEHLIVALHSHAFLCLSIAVLSLLSIVSDWISPSGGGFAANAFGWLEFGVGWWMPIYLLIMQKRVYRQGWIMTLLKFSALGFAYTFLLSFGFVIALMISLVWL